MPQTVSPVDPIPSPPSAKIPAGGTLCERRRHTCVFLARRYGTSLHARQARQPDWEWRRARALDTQEEDPGGDKDSRLLGRDAASLPQVLGGVGNGSPTPRDVRPGL